MQKDVFNFAGKMFNFVRELKEQVYDEQKTR